MDCRVKPGNDERRGSVSNLALSLSKGAVDL
jgi:hypothetical protein